MSKIVSKLNDYRINSKGKMKLVLDAVEFLAVIISFPISIFIVKKFFIPSWDINISVTCLFSAYLIVSWYVLSRITAMAKIPRTQRYITLIFQFIRVNFIILFALLFIKVAFRLTSIPLAFIFTYVLLTLTSTLFIRLNSYRFLQIYRANGYDLHHVLIIADSFSDRVIERLFHQKEWGFQIKGIITNSKLIKAKYSKDIPIIEWPSDIKAIIDRNVIDEVIYCKSAIDDQQVKEISEICNEVGVIFRMQSSVSPLSPLQLQLKTLNNTDQLTLVDIPSNNLSLILKTVTDIYFSFSALVLLSPVMLMLAIIIKLDSKGPVFFKQERIGLRGRKFQLYKFRTMVINAEKMLDNLKDKNQADGPVFKIKKDPRITRIGLILRKTGLDEIPQFYNVLKGEMSLIGPRPPLESEVRCYERWQLRRLSVKPGITCTWQVIPNRNEVKFEKWMRMDLNYIDNWSLIKDFQLIFKTIRTIFLAGGR
ncbi:MAG TPA: sugar transferase [Bacteroidales bacterium]|nr:sugar transferase [Bacteroidales bacterium]